MVDGKPVRKPRSGFDTIIAAVAEANNCIGIVVTDNEKDFAGIEILNPLG